MNIIPYSTFRDYMFFRSDAFTRNAQFLHTSFSKDLPVSREMLLDVATPVPVSLGQA